MFSLAFGEIAGLCRFTRAELTETLTSDYMLLARTKGLTRSQATVRHALKNAMVPILPMIIGSFIGILGGSMIIEQIFSIPGVGRLYIQSISLFDYDCLYDGYHFLYLCRPSGRYRHRYQLRLYRSQNQNGGEIRWRKTCRSPRKNLSSSIPATASAT